ncbi:SGNH/GDSL hydrolase family protein [Variovorax sp. ZT5P30]|uniref:SGNH/GDSL hydrolase family protein n=1 Tax=Variovorax sp. ZT5P30 TaxID=3443735 RepID=UPI003F46ACE9
MPDSTRIPSWRSTRSRTIAIVLGTALATACSQSHVAPSEDHAKGPVTSLASRSGDRHGDLHPGLADDSVAAAAKTNAACSVELYGDSILHGGYLGDKRLDEAPAAAIRRMRPRYHVVDRSVNGETASARSAAFANEARSGRIVVIEHGLNDAMQNLPLESALRSMVSTARAEGRDVVLTGLSQTLAGADVRARGDATVRRVTADLAVPFADWGSVPMRRGEMADILHPSQAYSTRLVERLIKVLDNLAPECA